MKKIIVAYDKNRGIGADNDLLWNYQDLKTDMRHFKELTTDSAVIMGRKTFESIGRPLPHRHNIVMSHNPQSIGGVAVVSSLEAAYEEAGDENVYVIGGGDIYTQALASVDEVIATEVNETFPAATVFFPVLGDDWQETSREYHESDQNNKYSFNFVTYTKQQ